MLAKQPVVGKYRFHGVTAKKGHTFGPSSEGKKRGGTPLSAFRRSDIARPYLGEGGGELMRSFRS